MSYSVLHLPKVLSHNSKVHPIKAQNLSHARGSAQTLRRLMAAGPNNHWPLSPDVAVGNLTVVGSGCVKCLFRATRREIIPRGWMSNADNYLSDCFDH